MKLHDARQLGSTSVLLNNIDTYVKGGKIWPSDLEQGPLERFKQTRIPGKLYAKIRENITKQFLNKWPKCVKKAKILIYLTLKKDI